ncbi:MAG: type II toxin-antitoxin system VapC family toxin [Clostridiales bacterium]|nr:type II toxin-antitoxin system VapC family toxin [Clostridiales bacterium]
MRYLLDTHILIWALSGEEGLMPPEVAQMIDAPENEICFSSVSIWEVAIKNTVRPGQMGVKADTLARLCGKAGIRELPMTSRHALTVTSLARPDDAPTHKDPFDRMLIAQAKSEGMVLVTHDKKLKDYGEPCVMMV